MSDFLKKIIAWFTAFFSLISGGIGFNNGPFAPPDNNYPTGEPAAVEQSNIVWPEEKIFPSFAEPDGELIAFPTDILPEREMTAIACLQGFANGVKTRAVILRFFIILLP